MGKKFNHLNVPSHWEHYWTKYPEGYTILEALLNWVGQVDNMVDNVNEWNEYLDDFVATFDENLQDEVIDILIEWEDSGFLDDVINQALQTQIDDVQYSLNLKRDKSVPITLNDVGTDLLQALSEAPGVPFNLLSIPRHNSVTPETTTFIKRSSNLINDKTMTPNKNISPTGEIIDSDYYLSDYISILPNTSYSSEKVIFKAYYDMDYNFIIRTDEEVTFTTPANAYYVRVAVPPYYINKTARMNQGDVLLPFEPYYAKVMEDYLPDSYDGDLLKDKSISLNKLAFIESSNNLYNKNTVKADTFVDNNGVEQPSSINSLSDFISIQPNTVYSSKGAHTTVFYTKDKTFISRPSVDEDGATWTSPSTAYFVRLTISNPNVSSTQLNLGDTLLPYDDYKLSISKSALPDIATPENRTYYFSPEEIVAPYKSKVTNFTYYSVLDDYNNAFNTLATNHADYLTRATLGKDTSGTYDIYQFTAKPQQLPGANGIEKKLPKLIFVGGLHGEERNSIHAFYYLMKDICENWESDPLLEYLRWNVEFVFIPVANPWGWENGVTRHNVNGVDLNRNFPHLWRELTGSEYSGTAPLSEKESQYVATMIEENKDALFFGDFHTNGSTSTYENYDRLMWFSLCAPGELYDENVAITARYTVEKMTREYIKDYSLPNNVGYFGFLTESNVPGSAKTYGAFLGIPSCTFETFVKLPSETEKYSATAIQMGTELLGNWILNLIKQFRLVY